MMNLTFLHTNDLHGHVDELARLAAQARRLRREVESLDNSYCLLVDCGDVEERTVLEMAVTRGSAAMVYLAAAGYDLAVIGNGAPLSFGPQVIADMAAAADFPLLAANLLYENGDLVAGCTPSLLRQFGGVRVGFVGLAPRWHFWKLFRLRDPEPAPIVQAQIDQLRAAGATIIVLLSHLGLAQDLELIGPVRGIDLILGGHSHTSIYGGLRQSRTLIAQAGDYGRYLGRVDLLIDEDNGHVVDGQAELIPLDPTIAPDPRVMAAVAEQKAIVASMLEAQVGHLTGALDFDPLEESPAANLLADALRLRTGAHVALCQPTHLLAGLPAGRVTLGDLYAACKSPGNPAVRSLSGAQLLEMLEVGMDLERAGQIAAWGRGRANGRIAVSGLRARYHPARPAGQRISEATVQGQRLNPEQAYTVAGSDAEMTALAWRDSQQRGIKLSFELPEDSVRYEVPATLRDVLEDHVRGHSPIVPPAVGRIQVVS